MSILRAGGINGSELQKMDSIVKVLKLFKSCLEILESQFSDKIRVIISLSPTHLHIDRLWLQFYWIDLTSKPNFVHFLDF